MGFFSNQFSNVVEWNETREGVLFYKWQNQEIKKGSKLIIRPGQDAIFLYNGVVEGIFEDEGNYDIESQIIPFLTTLKSFKFGFNTPLRAEVLFINTKEMLVKWGTKNAINLPAPGLPGGMPIRAFGTFNCKIVEHDVVIDKLAGIRQMYTVEDVKERIIASLDQLLMSWISKEGRDMFNLQADARNIAKGIESDLDMDMRKIGIGITDFTIESFSYPEEIKRMQEKAAAQSMVGDMNRYTQMAAADGMSKGRTGSGIASDMVGLQMGMALGQQMVNQMNGSGTGATQPANSAGPKFCPNCGTPTNGMKFCGNCGNQLF
ncbi:MAG: SPFH domain-containing protein [Lachnospiraceae bacterium]|nr:SPFH domain-containing protein [Lachnospiraceae bacterium]MBP3475639.1 SPFH domain-containing protein [Lachnospiraceae bacterium]